MMSRPAMHSNRQICDSLRFCATPHGGCLSDIAGGSGYPRSRLPQSTSRSMCHKLTSTACYTAVGLSRPMRNGSTRTEMGIRNFLIEGVSGAGKTTVAEELQRRGYHVVHGDRELAYYGDPETGDPLDGLARESVTDNITFGHERLI